MDGESVRALMVDSDAKGAKERSMYDQACKRYEEGLEAIKKGILTKGGTKKRDAVNKRLGKLDKQYGAIRLSYNETFTYEGTGKNEVATSMTWECREDKAAQRRKFYGKYVLLTSLDESQELNIWKFYNVIRTVEETFHVLKTDLDIRPVYHKSDNGIKSHLNLAILAYWVVSVTKYRLKLKKHENVRWDEIMRIASTQVVVTAKVETVDGQVISIRQSTEAESKFSAIYDLLYINSKPLGKRKSMLHQIRLQKIRILEIWELHNGWLQCGLKSRDRIVDAGSKSHLTPSGCPPIKIPVTGKLLSFTVMMLFDSELIFAFALSSSEVLEHLMLDFKHATPYCTGSCNATKRVLF